MVMNAIFGCAGTTLSDDERAFFRDADPWGFILFKRNFETADQIRALSAALREAVGREAPILVDHEGGDRVVRLSPNILPPRPPQAALGQLMAERGKEKATEAARLLGRLLGADCLSLGMDVDCMPMVDVRQPDADPIMGDRAIGTDPDTVTHLGFALAEGLLTEGCLPVVKHMPGHGRATADSHEELPRVTASAEELDAVDFVPFRVCCDIPLGMTAHIVYDALDPDRCATLSPSVIEEVIRGRLRFNGLLMTDDLSMKALDGAMADRARDALAAGCDLVLHCNGKMDEMTDVARGAGPLSEAATERSERALAFRIGSSADRGELAAELSDLMGTTIA